MHGLIVLFVSDAVFGSAVAENAHNGSPEASYC